MYRSVSQRSSDAYRRIGVETSMHTMDQHQIVSLLYAGLLQSLVTARGALARGDVVTKCSAASRALRILEEGLSTGLDRVDGGELAAQLSDLYDYCARRLLAANAHNDDALFQEVQRLIEPLAESWALIKPGAATSASSSASNGA